MRGERDARQTWSETRKLELQQFEGEQRLEDRRPQEVEFLEQVIEQQLRPRLKIKGARQQKPVVPDFLGPANAVLARTRRLAFPD